MALTLLLSLPAVATAQDPASPRVTLALRGTPLDDALVQLVARARLDLTYTPDLVAGRYSYCVARDALPEDALRCVLGGTGLDFYRLSNGIYVLTIAPETTPRHGVFQGVVVDGETGEALVGASVVLENGLTGTATNASGRFAFSRLLPQRYAVRVSYVGYRTFTDTVLVVPAEVVRRTVVLSRAPAPILPLVVDGLAGQRDARAFDADALPTFSPFGAGGDLTAQMALLPGVTIGNVTADVHVQGGDAGEHDLRLDGAPVFAPPVLLNLIGPFSPFAIGQIAIEKAGFGPQTGSNTVGFIEASQTLQTSAPVRLDAQLDALSANLRLMGRHGLGRQGAGRWMVTGRQQLWDQYALKAARTYLDGWNRQDAFLRTLFSTPPAGNATADPIEALLDAPPTTGEPSIAFRDAHASYQLRPNPFHTFHASGYIGARSLHGNGIGPAVDNFEWLTHAVQGRYTAVLSSRWLASLQARTSRYELEHYYALTNAYPDGRRTSAFDGNVITETAAEVQIDYTPTPRALVQIGVSPIVTSDEFSLLNLRGGTLRHRASMGRVATYLNAHVRPSRSFQAELGFRATYVLDRKRAYPEPRVSLRYDSPRGRLGQLSIRVGAGLYEQFVGQYQISSPAPHALTSTTQVWMALDPSVEPSRAEHYSAEVSYDFGRGWGLHAEAYHKHQLRLYTVDYASLPSADNGPMQQSDFFEGGEGYASGIGGTLEKRWQSNRLSVTAQRAHVERATALSGASYYVVPWNEPWRVGATADLALTRRLVVLARWQSVWGRAWAFRQAYYDYLTISSSATPQDLPPGVRDAVEKHVAAYGLADPADNLLPAFHRLDLGAAYTAKLGGAQVQYRLDALNVLDHANVAELQLVGDRAYYDATGLLKAESRLGLPLTLVWAVRLTL